MSDFAKYLNSISEELRLLNEDISKIITEKKKEQEGKESKKPSLKSIESVTKMHKNKNEAENSNKKSDESREIDFIKDRLNRIFSK